MEQMGEKRDRDIGVVVILIRLSLFIYICGKRTTATYLLISCCLSQSCPMQRSLLDSLLPLLYSLRFPQKVVGGQGPVFNVDDDKLLTGDAEVEEAPACTPWRPPCYT